MRWGYTRVTRVPLVTVFLVPGAEVTETPCGIAFRHNSVLVNAPLKSGLVMIYKMTLTPELQQDVMPIYGENAPKTSNFKSKIKPSKKLKEGIITKAKVETTIAAMIFVTLV